LPPPRLCVFPFFTLYPFSFASSPLCFFFSLLLLVFLAPLFSRVLCVFPLLSFLLCFGHHRRHIYSLYNSSIYESLITLI
jgi:hypothetical protein